jgi:hypothetical protein
MAAIAAPVCTALFMDAPTTDVDAMSQNMFTKGLGLKEQGGPSVPPPTDEAGNRPVTGPDAWISSRGNTYEWSPMVFHNIFLCGKLCCVSIII